MKRTAKPFLLLLAAPALLAVGCARPQPTPEEVAGRISPPDLRPGPTPPGGPSMAATGAGAGGSGAAGYEAVGRIGSTVEFSTVPAPRGDQIDPMKNRMSPTTYGADAGNSSSGSGDGDTGNPIPPTVPLAAPPDRAEPARLAPGSNEPAPRVPAARPQAASAFGAGSRPAVPLPGH
ncbi:MAG: hypothetical protein JO250_13265 [Armatimonadetes bacterium]|nr:hypothetical protein [Armatimonadota bacterium]